MSHERYIIPSDHESPMLSFLNISDFDLNFKPNSGDVAGNWSMYQEQLLRNWLNNQYNPWTQTLTDSTNYRYVADPSQKNPDFYQVILCLENYIIKNMDALIFEQYLQKEDVDTKLQFSEFLRGGLGTCI